MVKNNHRIHPKTTLGGMILQMHVNRVNTSQLWGPDNVIREAVVNYNHTIFLLHNEKNPVEQRKLFEKTVQDCVSFSVRTLRQWISQTKSIFKDNKNRKIDHRKITEYFNTNKINSKK